MWKPMTVIDETLRALGQIPNVQVSAGAPLALYTRFGLGGPADIYAQTDRAAGFVAAVRVARLSGLDYCVLGGGTNLVAADEGYRGIVLRFTGSAIAAQGHRVAAEAGAELQTVVDFAIRRGLGGLETLAGIPGSLGAAIYGNAGAYGRSIAEAVARVTFFDGQAERALAGDECEFRYRESLFKRHKEWVVFSAELALVEADAAALRRNADEILALRHAKFPPTMKCAGSVFKNLLASELPPGVAVPPEVEREGKVPAAYFLDQVGAKGLAIGGIHVADYHANLIYNDGAGAARQFRELAAELKARVRDRFGLELQEEVQYLGFGPAAR